MSRSCPAPIFLLGFWSWFLFLLTHRSSLRRSLICDLSCRRLVPFVSWLLILLVVVFLHRNLILFYFYRKNTSFLAVGFESYLTLLIWFFKNPHGFFWGFMVYICLSPWCCWDLFWYKMWDGVSPAPLFFWRKRIISISWSLMSYMGNNLSSVFCWTLWVVETSGPCRCIFQYVVVIFIYQCWPKKSDWNTTHWWVLFWNKFCRIYVWSILIRLVIKGAMIAN